MKQPKANPPCPKNALKRIRKAEQMKIKRKFQKQQRKERKRKANEEAKKLQQEDPSAQADLDANHVSKKVKKRLLEAERVILPQRIVIDCSFDSLMTEKEVVSLSNQITRCYSANNKSGTSVQLHLTGFGGQLEKRITTTTNGFQNWKHIHVEKKGYLDVFPKEALVYLSSESPNVIQTLDDDKVYIIGGLVDHNRLKGLTYKTALEQGIATAQLPIGEYLQMATRKVLTVNHVFEILLRYKTDPNWEQAMLAVMPKRKGAKGKSDFDAQQPVEEQDEDEDEEEEESEKQQEKEKERNVDVDGKEKEEEEEEREGGQREEGNNNNNNPEQEQEQPRREEEKNGKMDINFLCA